MFAGADEDVDGILSAAEIVKNHDLFVGSEATDYGEHLHNPNRLDDELWNHSWAFYYFTQGAQLEYDS